jgi:hypothetical protein
VADIYYWPDCVLRPQTVVPRPVPFTRSGGTTLGGVTPAVSTDLGFWRINYGAVTLRNKNTAQWRTWQALRTLLNGRSGLVEVPVWGRLSSPYLDGVFEPPILLPHSDDTPFSDGTMYEQLPIAIQSVGATDIGRTTITMNVIKGSLDLAGTRFGFKGALYEVGKILDISGSLVTVNIFPTVRELIPSGSDLNFVNPTCICRLATDSEMDIPENFVGKNAAVDVTFEEATSYWNELAS